jgi:cerevisin
LDRVDQREVVATPNTYFHGVNDGEGVNAYIVDTGIDIDHADFGGRAIWGFTADGLLVGDGNGHGTHCAGSVGSNSYGVAQSVSLIAVKVMNAFGSGTTDDIVAGLDYVRATHQAGDKSVINLSLGSSSGNLPMDQAIEALVADGVSVVVAAGNSDADSCDSSPGRVAVAITVGASDNGDTSATFTNWGTCLDVFAPGVDILSTAPGDDTATMSGTSMACPHVVGGVARYMSSQGSAPTPAACEAWVTAEATSDALSWSRLNHNTSPNKLLYVNGLCA